MLSFESLIQTKGLSAAHAERDSRKLEALLEFGLTLEQFEGLIRHFDGIDREFRQACERALSLSLNVKPSPLREPVLPPMGGPALLRDNETQADWILRQLKQAEGQKMFGPDLYDRWEHAGGSRRSIQSSVSQLIHSGRVKKGDWDNRGRSRGSWLQLPD